MMNTIPAAIVLALAIGVLWLAQRTACCAWKPDEAGPGLSKMLLVLFAWSFVLGAVMRWARLSN
jgi:hypothetical protein